MAEPTGNAVAGHGADRQTLRYWPWLAMCLVGSLVFGFFAGLAGYALAHASTVTGHLVSGGLMLGLGALTVYTLASLRTRTVLEPDGITTVGAFSRTRLPWSQVSRLDVTHSLPGWVVRALSPEDEAVAVYLCHDTHGRRPRTARTFDEPPAEAPAALRRGFDRITRYRQATAGQAGPVR